jgi:hypothetical protein
MKVLVAIPSYNRPYEIEKKCGYWLKELIDIDWKVFVREEQFIFYSQVIPAEHLVRINVNTFRETINAIGQYAIENGYDLVHKIDDDMSFKKLGMSKRADCAKVYQETHTKIVQRFIEDENLYGLSVSKPMAHIRSKDLVFTRENKALYGNYLLRAKVMAMPEGIELYDDVYFALEILRIGKKTLTYTGSYEDAVCYKNGGGLQSINRNKIGVETIKVLQKYFPEVKQGTYKGNEDMVDIDLKSLNIK